MFATLNDLLVPMAAAPPGSGEIFASEFFGTAILLMFNHTDRKSVV